MTKRAPVETKVVAATGATAGGGVVATFAIWLLGVLFWNASADADQAGAAIGAVPAPVTAIVGLFIVTASTFLGGYLARHTPKSEAGLTGIGILIALAAAFFILCCCVWLTGHVNVH